MQKVWIIIFLVVSNLCLHAGDSPADCDQKKLVQLVDHLVDLDNAPLACGKSDSDQQELVVQSYYFSKRGTESRVSSVTFPGNSELEIKQTMFGGKARTKLSPEKEAHFRCSMMVNLLGAQINIEGVKNNGAFPSRGYQDYLAEQFELTLAELIEASNCLGEVGFTSEKGTKISIKKAELDQFIIEAEMDAQFTYLLFTPKQYFLLDGWGKDVTRDEFEVFTKSLKTTGEK